ncbi:MAG: L,D-transpeptidase [Candidatus Paceibacterota bacterium]
MLKLKVVTVVTVLVTLFNSTTALAEEVPPTPPSNESLILKFKEIGVPLVDDSRKEFLRSLCALRELLLGYTSREDATINDKDLITAGATINSKFINGLNVSQHCQMAYFVREQKVVKVIPVSSGAKGFESKKGEHKTSWRFNGWRESSSYPGSFLYKPVYYYKGQAVHGMRSDSLVKTYPASHGCIRVKQRDARFLFTALTGNMQIKIYGDYYRSR